MFKDPKFWLQRLILQNGVHVDHFSWHHVIILISLVFVRVIFQCYFYFYFELISCLGTRKKISLGI